ncbi:MAG: zinc-dependent metalloprotease [Deltaproteobacteria bacterium]|nr:zinc-dependent metalloprotease [Deltaproteobacteria bacterium]
MRRALGLALLLFSAGCAQDVGDVDRTQPYRLKKALFDGEWYHQKTTIDVPYSAGFTFTGETSETERVKWEIQEEYLIAYRTYDLVENTHQSAALPDVELKGAPVAAYRIVSHFDVVRDYNAQTGEETNVILENSEDRPWYERDSIRVDWSKNLVVSFGFLDDQVSQAPMGYFVQERGDADALLVGVKEADGWHDHQDWREIAALEHAEYLDLVDTIFATPETLVAEDEYGDLWDMPACWFYASSDCQPSRIKIRSSFLKVDPSDQYEAMAYPDNAIARDEQGEAIRDSSGDPVRLPYFDKFGYFRVERDYYDRQRERTESGRTYLISRWGIWQDAPGCKDGDSYARCTVRPIVYRLSPGFPEALKGEAAQTVQGWNQAFKQVVNQLKYGGQRPLDQVEDVFLLADNSYAPGTSRGERIGDLRHSFIYWVAEPQAAGPLGYGPSAMDPLSGRIISGNAYVYGAALESWAAWGADVVQLLNGEIPSNRFIEGEDVRQYVERVRGDYAAQASRSASERLEEARRFAKSDRVTKGRQKQRQLGKRRMRLDRGAIRDRLSRIKDTPFESRLLNDEIIRALKPETRGQGDNLLSRLSDRDRRQLSPANWGTVSALRARDRARDLKIRKASLELESFADDAVAGLAESLRGRPRDEVRQTILARVFASTAEHEVGHTLGLRHNFGGSYDALNYPAEYWSLRGNQPQPFQPMTPEQVQGRMREYQYASIMDYGARFNSDVHGLGRYDRAAIWFGYGELVETFEQPPAEPLAAVAGLEFALHELRHYTSLPRLFGGDASRMAQRRLVPYREIIAQATGRADTSLVEVPYRFCSDEYDGALAWCNTWDEGADPSEIVQNAADAYEGYYVFNNFARDQRELDSWDHLGRVYERYFIHAQNQYQQWVFNAWDLEGYWEALREDARGYGIEDLPYDQAIDGGLAGANASRIGLNLLARVIQTPEPGAYYVDPDDGLLYNFAYEENLPLCSVAPSDPYCSDLNVDLGLGKYAFSLYDGASGYYFFDRLHVIGSFYDKLAAIETLTSPETNFLGVDIDADLTQYAISMHLFFPEEVTRLVGGAAVEAYQGFAGVVDGGRFRYRDIFAPASEYAGKPLVDPATSFTIELYAAWMGMAFLNANFDNSFNDVMRVYVEGSGAGLIPTVSDPARIGRFVHARTGRTFVAIRAEDPAAFSPAYELVRAAQRWVDTAAERDPGVTAYYVENAVAILETMRGLDELYGKLYF